MKYVGIVALALSVIAMVPQARAEVSFVAGRAIGPEEFLRLMQEKDAVVIDVRDDHERVKLAMKGALHIPNSQMTKDKMTAITANKDAPILLFCNYSILSAEQAKQTRMIPATYDAVDFLSEYGYKNIYRLAEGSGDAPGFNKLPFEPMSEGKK